ncbi:MAG: hypothetical protein ABSD74_04495 [Rhizomicrobium sp.]|jgi:tetratricopeptide (TPR) repeat protein
MAEEDRIAEESTPASQPSDAAAWAALSSADREHANAFLEQQKKVAVEQEALLRLQAKELSHELQLRHWSRRFSNVSAVMKVTFEVGLALIVIAITVFIGAAMWNARQAEGLVVDSFAVPPGYAQAGITGSVVADDMTQKIAAIRDFANDNSLAYSKDVREAGEDVKVEIPETGISISEVWRYLRLWLGSERHLNGNLRALSDGRLALTVSLGGSDAFTFAGKPGDLDSLEQKAAERIFETVEPVNYVIYLGAKGRNAETLEWAARNLSLWTDNRNLAEAYALYADMMHAITGDVRRALALTNTGIALDPASTPPHMESLAASRDLGHDEDVLVQARAIAALRQQDNVGSWRTGPGYPWVQQLGAISRAGDTGDFANLSVLPCLVYCSLASSALLHAEAFARLHDVTHAKVLIAEALSLGAAGTEDIAWNPYANLAMAQYYTHAVSGDWRAAVIDARHIADNLMSDRSYGAKTQSLRVQIQVMPLLAYALAGSGDFAAARKTISRTPPDCYACVLERGNVAALAKSWGEAQYWFGRATAQAPSIPFAYMDWGAMLLHDGDYGGAIAKFTLAHSKGPRFADPLEMWGEALMLENRSDLALAKFEEANKYAPSWGRLHLEWGKALVYLGKKDEAKKQFETTASLDLSSTDKSALLQWQNRMAH